MLAIMEASGMGISAIEGGNVLTSEDNPKKAAIIERAPKVLLLNILFWYGVTYPIIVVAG